MRPEWWHVSDVRALRSACRDLLVGSGQAPGRLRAAGANHSLMKARVRRNLAHVKGLQYGRGVTHHLVGVREIAEMLGVSRQRADQLSREYEDFPAPEVALYAGRVWLRSDVELWMRRHPDRRPGRPRT